MLSRGSGVNGGLDSCLRGNNKEKRIVHESFL